ncbi:uncharacterized protein PHACADRAFT_250656 [Phanerochaete carnosa HHB-10118-sp]|uniref:Endonuclease/exonuclease/phosphatase domain-containing protein n=1 Tax=Phanerochaete carnosa (strain HHB-10118-sp) TaxID=650164 RepID=K5WKG3_PHACS|nr:uncharacterized protein PHACADRAFT_250656 [Phanerochaete carnosa HHB-10118-sp]EKM59875.1 hypothetical protein PHACADRAFT_250656 [Phanerochaete carnosa HHB-10118-sp]
MSKRPAEAQTTLESWQPIRTKKSRVEATEITADNTPRLTKILSRNVETPIPFLGLPAKKIGGSATNDRPRPHHLRELLKRHSFPDFLCLQEVRARQADTEWVAALQAAVNSHGGDPDPRYAIYTSLNRATRGQRHFGTSTFVREPSSVVAAREVDWDAEGRIVILELAGGWALVNVYALNGSGTRGGTPRDGLRCPRRGTSASASSTASSCASARRCRRAASGSCLSATSTSLWRRRIASPACARSTPIRSRERSLTRGLFPRQMW